MIPYFKLDYEYDGALFYEFRRTFKREFFAYRYSNHRAMVVYRDFREMYCMGGEL